MKTPAKKSVEADPDYDWSLANYISSNPEGRLKIIYSAYVHCADERTRAVYEGYMLAITADIEEHPEWFDHGCLCKECRYA